MPSDSPVKRPPGRAIRTPGAGPMACALMSFWATSSGCAASVGVSGSVLPNIGLEITTGAPIEREGHEPLADLDLEWEANVTYQFLDDESLSGDGHPAAGDWVQAGVSLRALGEPVGHIRWTARVGLQWFDAGRFPNIIDEPGDYVGLRIGVGFETLLRPDLTFGPEVSLMPAYGGGARGFQWTPQLTWGLRWTPALGAGSRATSR